MTPNTVILDLQWALLRWDPECLPKWGVDGRGGKETLDALNRFKLAHGQKADGKLDRWTRMALGMGGQSKALSWWQKLVLKWVENKLKETPMWKMLEGKKTYIATAVAALAIIVNHFFGPLPGIELDPDQWLTQLGTLVFPVTIRAAIPNKNKVENGGTK